MSFVFKQAVSLCGKDYHRGVHRLSGAILEDAIFKKYCALGMIISSESEPILAPQSIEERNKKLAEKLSKPVEKLAEEIISEKPKVQDSEKKKSSKK